MARGLLRKLLPPVGPLAVIAVVGLLVLGALLYTKAVRAQRFLEPVLAVTEPVTTFSRNLQSLFLSEFGGRPPQGVRLIGDSIFVESSLLSSGIHHADELPVLGRIGRIFQSILGDADLRPSVEVILVSATVPLHADTETMRKRRSQMADWAGLSLNSLYREAPELERSFSTFFASAVTTAEIEEDRANWIEFRIIPSHLLHIEVLQRLEKHIR
jgi:hypothetical protein